MALFVVDASVTLAWCFEDETTEWTEWLLDRLTTGDRMIAPAHWPTEISNGLLTAIRRQRIEASQAASFWDELGAIPIDLAPPLSVEQAKAVLDLSQKFGLTVYDAAYLELALRRKLPLATLDRDLKGAAERAGVHGLPFAPR